MIKVLHKAFGILELIAKTPNAPKSVTELADAMGLNQPTTVRIVKDLCGMGYLEQVSSRGGYVLGPMAFQIGSKGTYMEELLDVARPLIKNCAETLKQSVLLTVCRSQKRYILYHENHNPNLNIQIKQLYDTQFFTATGRVQMAYSSEKELFELLGKYPLPVKTWGWGHVTDYEQLKKALASVKKDGFCKGHNYSCSLIVMAFPVFKNNKFVASLGASIPDTSSDEETVKVFNEVKKTAAHISAGLSPISSFA